MDSMVVVTGYCVVKVFEVFLYLNFHDSNSISTMLACSTDNLDYMERSKVWFYFIIKQCIFNDLEPFIYLIYGFINSKPMQIERVILIFTPVSNYFVKIILRNLSLMVNSSNFLRFYDSGWFRILFISFFGVFSCLSWITLVVWRIGSYLVGTLLILNGFLNKLLSFIFQSWSSYLFSCLFSTLFCLRFVLSWLSQSSLFFRLFFFFLCLIF